MERTALVAEIMGVGFDAAGGTNGAELTGVVDHHGAGVSLSGGDSADAGDESACLGGCVADADEAGVSVGARVANVDVVTPSRHREPGEEADGDVDAPRSVAVE